jgi:hypothetical protein
VGYFGYFGLGGRAGIDGIAKKSDIMIYNGHMVISCGRYNDDILVIPKGGTTNFQTHHGHIMVICLL